MSDALRNTGGKTTQLLAHRGTSIMAPENTAPAFDFAMQHNADVLEIDVRLSRDGEVVVIHDQTLDRTSDGTGFVCDRNLGDLKRLDAAYRFEAGGRIQPNEHNPYPFRGQSVRLLTLAELFERYPQVGVNIDIKDDTSRAVDAVVTAVLAAGAIHRTVVASFHNQVLDYCRSAYPAMATSAGMTDVKKFYWWFLRGQKGMQPVSVKLFQLPVKYYGIPLASRKFINAIHDADAAVNYWTINNPAQMVRLLEKRVDGIVTDRADLANDVLQADAAKAG